jgi:hypothetical protein
VIGRLKRLFPDLDWSTFAKAAADRKAQHGNVVASRIETASQIEELGQEMNVHWVDSI